LTQSAAKLILLACLLASVGGCAALAPRNEVLPGLNPPVVEVPATSERQSLRSPMSAEAGGSVPGAGYEARDKVLSAASAATIRGQTPEYGSPPAGSYPGYGYAGGGSLDNAAPGNSELTRQPMTASDATTPYAAGGQPVNAFQPGALPPAPPPGAYPFDPAAAGAQPYEVPPTVPLAPDQIFSSPSDLDVFVEEARTGRFSFGVAVNSNNGLTGQITVEERSFDITRLPRSWDDLLSGGAFRGGGQYLRLEAYPGNRVQRYLVSLTEPYLFGTNISSSISASYFDRNYFDYFESRYGGRLGFGYRLTPDLSVNAGIRAESVSISDPRVNNVDELERVLGRSDVFGAKLSLMHDTRDLAFMPTEGHLIQLSGEQVFGDFDFPRAEVEYNKYWMVRERPDGSGRHTLAFSSQFGYMGPDAPLFEHYFAGGFSTLRGFSFRGAGPIDTGVRVGGEFQWINSLEYFFPLTADDMVKGVVFCDFGTVEEDLAFRDNFRVAPGFGLRIAIPMMGPAPLALDFAFPISYEDTDDRQNFSFFFGASRQ
jgi:outer membrane protein insertion porin family